MAVLHERSLFSSLLVLCVSASVRRSSRKPGLQSLMIETMTAIDDFECFVNFMDNAAAGLERDDSDGRGEEEGKR